MTDQEIETIEGTLTYWVKMERCDFSSNDSVLKMYFEKMVALYKMAIGAKKLYVPAENVRLDMIDL